MSNEGAAIEFDKNTVIELKGHTCKGSYKDEGIIAESCVAGAC